MRPAFQAASLGLLLICHAGQPACALEATSAKVTDFGRIFEPKRTLKTGRSADISHNWPNMEARYYRVHLRIADGGGEPWVIAFKTPVGRALASFDQNSPECAGNEGCWTRMLPGAKVVAEFRAKNSSARAFIDLALFMPSNAANPYYSPIPGKPYFEVAESPPQELPLNGFELEEIRQTSQRLGMFVSFGKVGTIFSSWCCSGTLLTRDLFMTNWHCGAPLASADDAFWTPREQPTACRNGIVDISWDGDLLSREYACKKVEFKNDALDVAIIRLSQIPDGARLVEPIGPLALSSQPISAADELEVYQHPSCQPKSVSALCQVLNANNTGWRDTGAQASNTEFTYNCSTEGGSSGGPVFIKSNPKRLIGIHHLGYEEGQAAENTGVKITEICNAIRIENAVLATEIGCP